MDKYMLNKPDYDYEFYIQNSNISFKIIKNIYLYFFSIIILIE